MLQCWVVCLAKDQHPHRQWTINKASLFLALCLVDNQFTPILVRSFLNRSKHTKTVCARTHRLTTYLLLPMQPWHVSVSPRWIPYSCAPVVTRNNCWCLVLQYFPYLPLKDNSETVKHKIKCVGCNSLSFLVMYLQLYEMITSILVSSSYTSRSSFMRTDITMSTASAVSAAIALWQMSPSPARMMPCSAMTATVMSSHPSVLPATRSSCQVRMETMARYLFTGT